MNDFGKIITELWMATFMGSTATAAHQESGKNRYREILAGWKSPAEVEAACVAAQREAFENAAKVADDFFSHFKGMVIGDPGAEIRALAPPTVTPAKAGAQLPQENEG